MFDFRYFECMGMTVFVFMCMYVFVCVCVCVCVCACVCVCVCVCISLYNLCIHILCVLFMNIIYYDQNLSDEQSISFSCLSEKVVLTYVIWSSQICDDSIDRAASAGVCSLLWMGQSSSLAVIHKIVH